MQYTAVIIVDIVVKTLMDWVENFKLAEGEKEKKAHVNLFTKIIETGEDYVLSEVEFETLIEYLQYNLALSPCHIVDLFDESSFWLFMEQWDRVGEVVELMRSKGYHTYSNITRTN